MSRTWPERRVRVSRYPTEKLRPVCVTFTRVTARSTTLEQVVRMSDAEATALREGLEGPTDADDTAGAPNQQ
jgi:hypothetical protein